MNQTYPKRLWPEKVIHPIVRGAVWDIEARHA